MGEATWVGVGLIQLEQEQRINNKAYLKIFLKTILSSFFISKLLLFF